MVDNFSVSYVIIQKIILEKRVEKEKKKKTNSWNSIWHPIGIQFSNYVLNRRIHLFSWSPFPLQGRDLVLVSPTSPSTWSGHCHKVGVPYLRTPYLKDRDAGAQQDSLSYAKIVSWEDLKLAPKFTQTCSQAHCALPPST